MDDHVREMRQLSELVWTSATDLARLYRSGEVSPTEVVDAVFDRLRTVEPLINAFVTVTDDLARKQAQGAEVRLRSGDDVPPLCGIPISVKDLIETAGVRTTYGCKSLRDNVPEQDAISWQRLKQAGAILIGKTTTPEHGMLGVTESHLTGTTGTPWDPARTSGGSSGGAAAAAAAGVGPLALGSDGGGSIRVPAACCGVVGVKPSAGRIPVRGNTEPDHAEGPLTRTVADAALMLSVLAGPHHEDRLSLPATGERYLELVASPPAVSELRIAYSADLGQGPIDPRTRSTIEQALTAAEQAGAVVEPVALKLPDTIEYFVAYWGPEFAEAVDGTLKPAGDSWPLMEDVADRARKLSAADVSRAVRGLKTQIYNEFDRVLQSHDLIITPTTPVPPFPHVGDKGGVDEVDGQPVPLPGLYFHRLTEPPSHAGLPAASIPAGFTSDGLPVGMQLIGRQHADGEVLAAAAAFEALTPWAHRHPLA
jgi:Asp-tRNA(Asn)/Glu-tRNA(Gln) amidotransferase A subunit family amidase